MASHTTTRPKGHCEHEYVCKIFNPSALPAIKNCPCIWETCNYDTRTRPHTPAPEQEEQWRVESYKDDGMDLYLNGVFISKCKDMVSVQCVKDSVKRAQDKAARTATLAAYQEMQDYGIQNSVQEETDTGFRYVIDAVKFNTMAEKKIQSLRQSTTAAQEARR
jgi:hypothetical protein